MKTDLKLLLANVSSLCLEDARTKLNDNDYVFIDVREKLVRKLILTNEKTESGIFGNMEPFYCRLSNL